MFSRGSRYEKVPNAVHTDAKGRRITYKLLRIIPPAPGLQIHSVKQGERLDVIAFHAYRDAEQAWRIADANYALRPEELTEFPGRRLVIPLPQR